VFSLGIRVLLASVSEFGGVPFASVFESKIRVLWSSLFHSSALQFTGRDECPLPALRAHAQHLTSVAGTSHVLAEAMGR
jgi:hypothetical protein